MEDLQAEVERLRKTWDGLHTACSELVSMVEQVDDMEGEDGEPYWEPELANALRWIHIYPQETK